MATVYLAHDLRHDRKVALKVLRPELSAVVGADRFLQEIKLTANLQHPHILPLHDSGQADSHVFYVMPYVEGESLRAKLLREKQLSVDEALEITKAVASALDYAHRKGIIHRDIKPENILLHDGQAVVADFGIALAVSHAGAHRMTETGLSIGTPQYMSPEQAMGERELSAKSDVYALGCILYEMLVGEPPFTGPTAQAIVAKVITEKAPRISQYRDTVPANVDAAVRKALSKLPADRFSTAHEFAEALVSGRGASSAEASEEEGAPIHGSGARPIVRPWLENAPSRKRAPWLVSAALALAVVALAIRPWTAREAPAPPPARFTIDMPADARIDVADRTVALSRDGSRLVVGLITRDTLRLYLRRLDSLQISAVAGTEDARWATFSPDGRWIAFATQTTIKRIPAEGGAATALFDGNWSDVYASNGALYVAPTYNSGISAVTQGAAARRVLTTPDSTRKELGHWPSQLLPDGKSLLFTNYSLPLPQARIEVLNLDSGRRKIILEGAMDARYAGGLLFFARVDVIYAAPFDLRRLQVTGDAVPVLQDVAGQLSNGAAAYDVSENGTLVYVSGSAVSSMRTLVWVDRSGAERPARAQPANYHYPRLSPDGKRVAVGIEAGGGVRTLWVYEFDRDLLQRITNHQASSVAPVWSPDGQWLYWSRESPVFDLYRRQSNAATPEELVRSSYNDKRATGFSPDGKILFFYTDSGSNSDIGQLPVDAPGKATPLLKADKVRNLLGVLSPDGHWLAYQSSESGRTDVYLRSYPDLARVRHQVSTNGGEQPAWTRDGHELVYREGTHMVAVPVDASGSTGRPAVLFTAPYDGVNSDVRWYDVTADGQRFLMVKPVPNAARQQVIVVTNWLQEVKKKLGR